MKKNNKKGFTLAELLIVVAIIAVLTAVAIPVFTAQLHKSQDATDLANIRSKFAELQTKAITDGIDTTEATTYNKGDTVTLEGGDFKLNNLGFTVAANAANNGYVITYTCSDDNCPAGHTGSESFGGSSSSVSG